MRAFAIASISLVIASSPVICCGATPSVPTARTLMLIAFPDWNPKPPVGAYAPPHTVSRYLHLTRREISSQILPGYAKKAKYDFFISPLMAASFDQSHAILLTSDQISPSSIGLRCEYSCINVIGAYFFVADATGWRLSKSIPVASIGWVSLYPSHAKVVNWVGHELVASFRLENRAQGLSYDDVYLLGLTPDNAIPLVHTSIAENNDAAVEVSGVSGNIGCSDVLTRKFVTPPGVSLNSDITCYRSNGSWDTRGNTIVFHFHGRTRSTGDNGNLLPLKSWHKTAVLLLQKDGSLKLIHGHLLNYTI